VTGSLAPVPVTGLGLYQMLQIARDLLESHTEWEVSMLRTNQIKQM
jgi:hypothetical protein